MSIGEVRHRFGLPASTLHYWERRGLLTPTRRAGIRYYDEDQVCRIALIATCREIGMLGVDEVAAVLHGTDAETDWRAVVRARMSEIDAQIAALRDARGYLEHLTTCRRDRDVHTCPAFRADVENRWPIRASA